MEEIWKPAFGLVDMYEVSSLGRVRSLDRFIYEKAERKNGLKVRLLVLLRMQVGINSFMLLLMVRKLTSKFIA